MSDPKELGWSREQLGKTYTRDELVKRTAVLIDEYPNPRSNPIKELLEEIVWAIRDHMLAELEAQYNNQK
jgi:hypothetical protein